MSEIRTLFILSLEGDFATLHNNMTYLPAGWETEDFKQLTMISNQYLATVVSNRVRDNIQQ